MEVAAPARPTHPPLQVRAVRVSTGIELGEGIATGTVESVHQGSINLRLDGRLVTVAREGFGGLPNGALVADTFSPAQLGIRPGLPVQGCDRWITIDGRVVVRLAGAPRWSPRINHLPASLPELPARAELFAGATARLDRDGLTGIVDATGQVTVVENALASGDEEDSIQAGRRLVGLGEGLTPAGDDLLVALSGTLAALGDPRAGRLAVAWAADAERQTTAVAASFHRHAARGEYSERLHDLLAAVLVGPAHDIPSSVARAARWGATSGVDALLGVAIGLRDAALRIQRTAA
jgi:hypothetical protein